MILLFTLPPTYAEALPAIIPTTLPDAVPVPRKVKLILPVPVLEPIVFGVTLPMFTMPTFTKMPIKYKVEPAVADPNKLKLAIVLPCTLVAIAEPTSKRIK